MSTTPRPRPEGLDKAWVPDLIKAMSRANVFLYRATGGIVGSKWRVGAAFPWGVPVCLLTTVGRKSGEKRTSPLLFIEDGSNVIVVASQGGLPKNPAWYLNVMANPEAELQIGRTVRPVRARTADAAERAALWPRLVEHYPDFASYAAWTDREIPVVILEPVGA